MLLRSRTGAVVIALTSHKCDPGSIPAQYQMWVVLSLLLGLVLLRGFFSGFSTWLSALHKYQHL